MAVDDTEVQARLAVLLERHGRTFADELGIPLASGTPEALFRWLTAAILYSGRIQSDIATRAAVAFAEAGWITAEALARSGFEERVRVLDDAHFTRYDERMARVLHDAAVHVRDTYDGDLRGLRAAVDRDPKAERARLQDVPGLGPTGAQIFCREAQAAWPELFPVCDKKAWSAAKELQLARSTKALAELVAEADFPRLVAALARAALAKDVDAVRAAAQERAAAGDGE
jgi:endonuclease III